MTEGTAPARADHELVDAARQGDREAFAISVARERGLDDALVLEALRTHLRRYYAGNHPVSVILESVGHGSLRHETRPLDEFETLESHIADTTALFCDVVHE
jgi:hypothetical protein